MAASLEISFDDVIRAGCVLFGPHFTPEAGGWREALRATWRRRAMETHPDRASALGRTEVELAREFEAVTDAYRILSSLGADPFATAVSGAVGQSAPPGGERGRAVPPVRAQAATKRRPRVRVVVPPEDLPRRKLRFAEYLYYSGRVRWTELAEALAWQRAQRPPVGRMAVELGVLAPDDVGVILERRRAAGANGIPFGEWAVRLGYLTPFELLAVLGRQLKRQRRIGEFFVERGLLGADDIEAIRLRILQHNSQCQARSTRAPRRAR